MTLNISTGLFLRGTEWSQEGFSSSLGGMHWLAFRYYLFSSSAGFGRLLLWACFKFLMSRLDLKLIPGHPDHTGGLKFLSSSLRGFRLIR